MTLTPSEKAHLLLRARRAAARALDLPPGGPEPPPPAGRLAAPGMCFVTWKRAGHLRGCIGSVEPVRPLWTDVEANAVHALLEDPRFPPATPDELARLSLEISVLSPFAPVSNPLAAVEIGVHGLLVERDRRRGLLLPQVAVELGWGVREFLGHACAKASLPPEAWRDESTHVSTFEAEVFGEDGGPASG